MKKRLTMALAAGMLLAAMLPGPAAADDAVNRYEANIPLRHYDLTNGLLSFSNITRDAACTPFMVEFEQWILDGAIGDPPEGQFPEGQKPISFQEKVTGQGAIVQRATASDLSTELWNLDDPAAPTGLLCHDTAGQPGPWATGMVSQFFLSGNDGNWYDPASGTRGKESSYQVKALVTDANGVEYRYTIMGHYTEQCHEPDGGLPVCVFVTETLEPMN